MVFCPTLVDSVMGSTLAVSDFIAGTNLYWAQPPENLWRVISFTPSKTIPLKCPVWKDAQPARLMSLLTPTLTVSARVAAASQCIPFFFLFSTIRNLDLEYAVTHTRRGHLPTPYQSLIPGSCKDSHDFLGASDALGFSSFSSTILSLLSCIILRLCISYSLASQSPGLPYPSLLLTFW